MPIGRTVGELLEWTQSRPRYFDRQGFPIPGDQGAAWEGSATRRWAALMEQQDYVVVAVDELPDRSILSTSWLGLDHGYGLGPPLFFETMRFSDHMESITVEAHGMTMRYQPPMDFPDIFADEPDAMTRQLRYGCEEEALAAHHEIVRRLRIREGH